jgi:hypothetical protein
MDIPFDPPADYEPLHQTTRSYERLDATQATPEERLAASLERFAASMTIERTPSGLVVTIPLSVEHVEALETQIPPPPPEETAAPPPATQVEPKDVEDAILSALADSASWVALAILQAFVGEAGRSAIIRAWTKRSGRGAEVQDEDADTIEIPIRLIFRRDPTEPRPDQRTLRAQAEQYLREGFGGPSSQHVSWLPRDEH